MEIDEIRRQKIAELQEKARKQQEEQEKIDQAEDYIKQYMTPEALERYGNIKVAHPDIAMQLIAVLADAIQNGKLKSMINDSMLKEILGAINQRHDIKITRR